MVSMEPDLLLALNMDVFAVYNLIWYIQYIQDSLIHKRLQGQSLLEHQVNRPLQRRRQTWIQGETNQESWNLEEGLWRKRLCSCWRLVSRDFEGFAWGTIDAAASHRRLNEASQRIQHRWLIDEMPALDQTHSKIPEMLLWQWSPRNRDKREYFACGSIEINELT
jgi:hypothetical protein